MSVHNKGDIPLIEVLREGKGKIHVLRERESGIVAIHGNYKKKKVQFKILSQRTIS